MFLLFQENSKDRDEMPRKRHYICTGSSLLAKSTHLRVSSMQTVKVEDIISFYWAVHARIQKIPPGAS